MLFNAIKVNEIVIAQMVLKILKRIKSFKSQAFLRALLTDFFLLVANKNNHRETYPIVTVGICATSTVFISTSYLHLVSYKIVFINFIVSSPLLNSTCTCI